LEAAIVDAGEERELAPVLLLTQNRHRAGLRQRLDDQHPGHDRATRKVPAEIPLILTYRLPRNRTDTWSHFDHLVDEEERLTVRKNLFDGDGHVCLVYEGDRFARPGRCGA